MLHRFYLIRGNPSRFVSIFAWPLVDIILWGFITRYLNRITSSGFNFVLTLLGAVLLWDFFTRVMQGITVAFFEDIWARNFLNLFSTPLSLPEYLVGLLVTGTATSLLGLVVMLGFAFFIFGLSFVSYGWMIFPLIIALFLFGTALGILSSAVVLKYGPSTEWFIWPIPVLLSPFVGVFYPLSVLPKWMQVISLILPPSYVFTDLRAIALGKVYSLTPFFVHLLAAFGIDLIYIAFSCFVFRWVYQNALKTGIIPRYSAENVT